MNPPAVRRDSRLNICCLDRTGRVTGERTLLTSDWRLPPLKTVQVALRDTTETLAHSLSHPGVSVPGWSDFEWRVARAAAALHGVSPILSGRVPGSAPADWRDFLAAQRAQTERRYARISKLLRFLDHAACAAGLAFVALKGAALHELGLYAVGERPMADLDLLVRAADADRMAEVLKSAHLDQTTVTWKHRVFEPAQGRGPASFGEDSRNGIKVDLHVRIREYLPRRAVDVTALMMPRHPRAGLNPYPSHSAFMLHLLLHAAGAIVFRTLRLVQLHDMALLSGRMSPTDWQQLIDAAADNGGLWWALAPLTLLARYYDSVPEFVLAASAAQCRPALLRAARKASLWQVSFSDLRRKAFPGIEWSDSAADALAYAAQRAGLAARVLARTVLTGSVVGGVDGTAGIEEPRLPAHGWVALRPVRPATLHAVRTAVAQPR